MILMTDLQSPSLEVFMKHNTRRLGLVWMLTVALVLVTVVTTAAPAHAVPLDSAGGTTVLSNALQTGPFATIISSRANLWAGPGRGFWVVGVLYRSEIVPITGVSADGKFWQVNSSLGQGYLYAPDVTASNTTGVPVANTGVYGSIRTGIAVIRGGPGINAQRVGTIGRGFQFYVLGAAPNGDWVQIRYRFGTGWVSTALTTLTSDQVASVGATVTVPVTIGDPTAIVNAGWLNIRSGPANIYSSLGKVPGGTAMVILAKNSDGFWLKVKSPFGDGWVNANFIITKNYFGGVPTEGASETSTTFAQLKVLGGTANVRKGPGLGFDVEFTADAGTILKIIGQTRTGWWYVQTLDGTLKGWINKSLGQPSGDIAGVPFNS
jgi:uncharacterized protein YgiM (DUF1202 family)